MYINGYALEVMTKTRLVELRADAARRVVLASLRSPQASVWVVVGSALLRAGRRVSRRRIVSQPTA